MTCDPGMAVTGGDSVSGIFRARNRIFPLGQKTYIMGILNITPDSFSDGGRFMTMDQALTQAEHLITSGADILDIGGESTRPGSIAVAPEEEKKRILPIIRQIVSRFAIPISVDTWKADVAEAALAEGACVINDICGFQGDPKMAATVSRYHAGAVLMHNAVMYRRSHPSARKFTNQPVLPAERALKLASLSLTEAVRAFLQQGCELAQSAGISAEQIMLDPGIGFGLTTEESLLLNDCLPDLAAFNLPILLGPSRKRYIGDILDCDVDKRQLGTAAAVAVGIARGADFVRVHDVDMIVPVVRMADAICRRCSMDC